MLALQFINIKMNGIQKNGTETVDKINVEDLIKDFKVLDLENMSIYLKDIWKVKRIIYFRTYRKEARIRS